MTRRRRTPAQREAICAAHNWTCGICHGPIKPPKDKWALDHIIPLAGGGSDEDENLHPVHVRCHAEKTLDDVKRIAKGRRVRAKFLGSRAPSRCPLPFGRTSKWKKKINGEVVLR